jgi:hypothetical protein
MREHAWWPELVRALVETPLDQLAQEHGHDRIELEQALADAGAGLAATDTPWWPEAVRRIQAGAPLRHTARSFATNPRRLRRGLARCGVRAGGVNLDGDGVEELQPLRERLGQEPDHVLATEAGVTVEAVQGERRRLGIDPFRPRRRKKKPRPVGLDEAFPRRPKTTRTKAWLSDDIPPVVRRNSRGVRGQLGRLPSLDRDAPRRSRSDAGPKRGLSFATLPTSPRAAEAPALTQPPKRRVRLKRRSADEPAK